MSVIGISALAAALAFSSPLAAPPAQSEPVAEVGAATDVVLTIGPKHLSGFWDSVQLPLTACPPEARYLDTVEYHPGSGYIIPRGVEIVLGDPDASVQVSMTGKGLGVYTGIVSGWIVSWSAATDTDVTVKLHCTDQR